MESMIPFPSIKESSELDSGGLIASATRDSAHGTDVTSSSKLTSSDKLSALPSPRNAFERPPKAVQHWPLQHNFRHSLDAAASLPSTSRRELETIRHDSWDPSLTQRRRREAGSSAIRPYLSSESSPGKETPKQRVSFDSEQGLQPNRVGQAFSRLVGGRASDPSVSPQPTRPDNIRSALGNSSPPTSRPHSRGTSPLRLFHQWSSGMHRQHRHAKEEPFIPVNPFKMKRRKKKKFSLAGIISPPPSPNVELGLTGSSGGTSSSGAYDCEDIIPVMTIKAFFEDVQILLLDTLPRQLYLNLLLWIPAMYFSRVARIFQDAEVSRPDIQRMIDAMCDDAKSDKNERDTEKKGEPGLLLQNHQFTLPHSSFHHYSPEIDFAQPTAKPPSTNLSPHSHASLLPLPFPDDWTPTSVSPSLYRFKYSWESFIDSLIREWKTLNVVSALLSSAILSIFQIPEAADDPVTRTLALLSLVSALMSLSYGCMYIVRFATMRSMFRASRWAEEARKTKTRVLWNVWVMLAMPAVWMSWAMIFFLSAILSFVWRTGSESDPDDRPPLSSNAALGPRIVITFVFVVGMIYMVMIIRTLKRYGGGGMQFLGGMETMLQSGARDRTSVHIGTEAGERDGHQGKRVGLFSRMRTPESDSKETDLEQRGRKRHRGGSRPSKSPRTRETYPPGEMQEVKRNSGVFKDLENSFNLKDGGVVSVRLSKGSMESV